MLPILNQKEITMSSREIAELTSKQHRHVKRDIERMATELEIDVSSFGRIYFDQYGREQTEYKLSYELTQVLITGYSIKLRHAVIRRLNELEQAQKDNMPALPNFNNPAEAARAWANEYEQRLLVEHQRDEAIRTKAWIGDKREATAMATASAAVRKANLLAQQLDQSQEYASIKRMEQLHGKKYRYQDLKPVSIDMGYPIKKIYDANYGEVNAYHRAVWLEVYGIEP